MEFGPIEILEKKKKEGGSHNDEELPCDLSLFFFLPSHFLNIGILTIYLLPGK